MATRYKAIRINGVKHDLHRVIMEQSLGRQLSSNEIVHHKDGNKLNNDLSNLELISSRSEHTKLHKDITQKKLQSPEAIRKRSLSVKEFYSKHSHSSSARVLKLDVNTNNILSGYSSMHVAERDGFNHRHISACCSGKCKTHGGFKWQLEKESVFGPIQYEDSITIES